MLKILLFIKFTKSDLILEKNKHIESSTEKWCRCLTRTRFYIFKYEFVGEDMFLFNNSNDFKMVTNKTTAIRSDHGLRTIRTTTYSFNTPIILISDNVEIFSNYFMKKWSMLYLRCLHLLVFTSTENNEYRLYQILKRIWEDYNILNVIVHNKASDMKNFLYSYYPFFFR